MKQVKIELNVDPEKFNATKQFMEEKGLKMESEIGDSITKFYKKYVPADVRKYIERNAAPTPVTHKKTSDSASNASGGTGSEEPVPPVHFENSSPTPSEAL